MLSKEEIEKAKGWLSALDIKSEFEAISKEKLLQYIDELEEYLEKISKQLDNVAIDQIPIGIAELQQENRNLKIKLNKGVEKEKRYCFYEDGKTGKCLGYSNIINDDEPCEYCKTCEALSIKGDD